MISVTPGSSSGQNPGDKRGIAETVDREVDRQTDQHNRVSQSVSTRAALLVTAALIFVSFPREEDAGGPPCLYATALICALVGALCGVFALLSKPKGEEASLAHLEEELWDLDETQALRALTAEKRRSLEQDRERLKSRHSITIVGFMFLSISVAAIVLYLIIGI